MFPRLTAPIRYEMVLMKYAHWGCTRGVAVVRERKNFLFDGR